MLKKTFAILLILSHTVSFIAVAAQAFVYVLKIIDNDPITKIPWVLALVYTSTGIILNFMLRKDFAATGTWKSPLWLVVLCLFGAMYFAASQDSGILPPMTLIISVILIKLSEGHFVYNVFAKPAAETKEG